MEGEITPQEAPAEVVEPIVDIPAVVEPVVDEIIPEGDIQPDVVQDDILAEGTTEAMTFSDLQFEGEDVSVEVPLGLATMFADKGFDAEAITRELYTDGFGLSEETISKLNESFGEYFVSSTLKGIEDGNKLIKMQASEATRVSAEADAKLFSELGLDDAEWSAIENYASTMNEAELAAFNKAMQVGDAYTQKLHIDAIRNKLVVDVAQQLDQPLDLITGQASAPNSAGVGYSAEEYYAAIRSGMDEEAAWELRVKGNANGL